MSSARAKTINLLLYEGDLSGVISIEDSSWNSGELYSAPRDSIMELLEKGACSKYGVYLLLSQEKVYIGQSSDLAKRITQHTNGKEWWESVIILTTKDDSLNHSDIDYLESVLIEKALKINCLDCDNKTKGNPVKVDRFRQIYLGQYLEEALFLMKLIGVTVFDEYKSTLVRKKEPATLINTIEAQVALTAGKGAKVEAINLAKANGCSFGTNVSYATKQSKNDHFWLNPRPRVLEHDWDMILNDNQAKELIVIRIPAHTFRLRSHDEGHLFLRNDPPERIDIKINRSTLMDTHGYANFSPYIVKRRKY